MISKLQYISQELEETSHQAQAEEVCGAGIDWFQLRVKNRTQSEWLKIAKETQIICKKHKARLIINDNVSIAKEIKADGVHLGKSDMSILEARKQVGKDAIIGGTANTIEDIIRLEKEGADYIGLGPFRFTSTKKNLATILGIEGYEEIMNACKKHKLLPPIIAVGGIKADDVAPLLEKGFGGIAVSSAISFSKNKAETINEFSKHIQFEIEKK